MTDEKKPIRKWGETPRAGGTMRDLRSLRPPDPKPTTIADAPPPQNVPTELPGAAAIDTTPSPTPPPQILPVEQLPKERAKLPRTQARSSQTEVSIGSFEEFKTRWKPFLRKGQLRICEALYRKTHAVGRTFCTTSFSELAVLSGLKVRQCFNLIAQLEELGLVERSRIAKGSNKTHAGSKIYFHLSPKE
jgi:DNA-binding MarR family transcriptional regulator